MAMTERSRWELREMLKERLGMDATNALLDELPALDHEPATKADIADVRVQIAEVRVEVARAADSLRKTMIWLIGSIFAVMMATVVGLVVPLVTLT